jgi:hypothetical protein
MNMNDINSTRCMSSRHAINPRCIAITTMFNLLAQAALRGGFAQRTIATLDSKLFLQVWRNYATAEASFEA